MNLVTVGPICKWLGCFALEPSPNFPRLGEMGGLLRNMLEGSPHQGGNGGSQLLAIYESYSALMPIDMFI